MNDEYDLRLKTPFTSTVSGPTGCGKTVFVRELIKNAETAFDEPPVKIYYCHGAWQKAFEEPLSPILEYREGLINVREEIPLDFQHRWLIIDDLMQEAAGSTTLDSLFTRDSHHMNLSVTYITQNLFQKQTRTVNLNAQYMWFFRTLRDSAQIGILGRQIFPTNWRFFVECYQDATKEPYTYLMLDMKQNTKDEVRVLGNYLGEGPVVVYDWK